MAEMLVTVAVSQVTTERDAGPELNALLGKANII